MNKLNTYYQLTKPGIIYGNAITAIAGFFLASRGHAIHLPLLLAMLVGTSLGIGGACVINNLIDRKIDAKMERTKKRAMVTGEISIPVATTYGLVLGLLGFAILFFYTNFLTVAVGAVGTLFYLVFYSIFKRRGIYGTLVGSVSGAMPPLAGYTAASNRLDLGALLLFLILTFWQMPHFYAIAIYRLKEYKKAGIPVLPAKVGIPQTKIHMIFYIVAFLLTAELLTFFHYTGYTYGIIVGLMGLFWLYMGLKGFRLKDSDKWARKMFFLSLVIILVFSVLLSLNSILQ